MIFMHFQMLIVSKKLGFKLRLLIAGIYLKHCFFSNFKKFSIVDMNEKPGFFKQTFDIVLD